MALGDGIRRNIRAVTPYERARFKTALLALLGKKAVGQRSDSLSASLSSWFEQDELHLATHLHRGPELLPWHREQCNRFEGLLREVDPELSLHYWDWNEDPQDLFAATPVARKLDKTDGVPSAAGDDREIVGAASFQRMRELLERKRVDAYEAYVGGTVSKAHLSFRDPFVFPLHANVDRLFAMWQAQPGQAWRLDPRQVYGSDSALLGSMRIDPWPDEPSSRPWAEWPSESDKTYLDSSVVAPPCYDTLPTEVIVDGAANPGLVINFNDVYAGKTFARAASFQVFGCGNLTFAVTHGPTGPYTVITPGGAVTVAHSPTLYQEARIWFGFTGGVPNTVAPIGTVTIRCNETNQDFVFTLQANTALPTAGVVLTADRNSRRTDADRYAKWADVTWTWTWKPAGG
jgi:Common central domain of tyrosinase